MCSDPRPIERLLLLFGYLGGEHSLSVCILAHRSPFVVPSAILVNIETRAVVVNKPGSHRWPLVDLREAQKPLRCLERDR